MSEQWTEYIIQEKRGSSHDLHWEDKIYGIDNINRAKDRIKALKDKNPFGQFRIVCGEFWLQPIPTRGGIVKRKTKRQKNQLKTLCPEDRAAWDALPRSEQLGIIIALGNEGESKRELREILIAITASNGDK